jgi:hypothetical protein
LEILMTARPSQPQLELDDVAWRGQPEHGGKTVEARSQTLRIPEKQRFSITKNAGIAEA